MTTAIQSRPRRRRSTKSESAKPVVQHNELTREWLESDGRGGYASCSVSGVRTRRYHALVMPALTPPTGRLVLLNGFDAWIETPQGKVYLFPQCYASCGVTAENSHNITSFKCDPWPQWELALPMGILARQSLFVSRETGLTVINWKIEGAPRGSKFRVRPFLSGRDYHSLHKENAAFQFGAACDNRWTVWQPYSPLPSVSALSDGVYVHEPCWYKDFLYLEERNRGLDDTEDLASPGFFEWDTDGRCGYMILGSSRDSAPFRQKSDARRFGEELATTERKRRASFASALHRAADSYIVERGNGNTIIAGYPWFTDWGRDTFIALRGLCIAGGRLDDARAILLEWADAVSEGMLPNRFADNGDSPEFNSVDASLWYCVAVRDYLIACDCARIAVPETERTALATAVGQILEGYRNGTRHKIHMDADCLIAAGESGVQLTWMDAKVGDWVVTPRIGKPVEIQALWYNALKTGEMFDSRWATLAARAKDSFMNRFWDSKRGYLLDVADADHIGGKDDPSFRPNQVFAIGGLPFSLVSPEIAGKVVDAVESRLFTPLGLRSLDPADSAYRGQYKGGINERDGAYHQGTVWPWLVGPFVEAWVRTRGNTEDAKREARNRFIAPLESHLAEAGVGHISEIADGNMPFAPAGCPFQAWSVGEILRLTETVLRPSSNQRNDL